MIRNEEFRNGVCVAADSIDVNAGTIAREQNGVVVSTRALTADEVIRYTPPAPVVPPEERLAAAQAALAPLETIAAPYTSADIVDVLLDVRTALGG